MRNTEGGKREELVAYLKTKRWFGEKGRGVRDATIRDVIPIAWPGSSKEFAVARADVTTDTGSSTYQLFLTAAEGREPRADVDALEDAAFRRGLADAWMTGATFTHGAARWIIQIEGKQAPLVVPPDAPITLTATEQTNSSVILNREAVLKLYRKLEPGVHPDVEVTRFLTIDRQFASVPVLMGTVRFEDGNGSTIAGMLQEYVPDATDGWTFVRERLQEHFAGTQGSDSAQPLLEEAGQLGSVTRALHETLASGDAGGDFDLRPATAHDLGRWERNAVRTVEHGMHALDRALKQQELPRAAIEEARVIQERGREVTVRINELVDGLADDAGGNTRTHGDLHLGQTLRSSAAQFLVIDFEGEPTRPLADRRARSSPLRDVAGMLRSFAYAAAASSRPESVIHWERGARAAFLRGYFSEANGRPGLLPRSRDNADRLTTLFELEKAFYELEYELDHRPDWVWIPLRGIAQLLS